MRYLVHESEVNWEPHQKFKGVKVKILHTEKDQNSLATIVMTKVPKGEKVPVHVHENSDNILHILEGRAKMEIDGIGVFQMAKGSCLRVPKNTKHQIYDVTEELIVYDVFAPPAF